MRKMSAGEAVAVVVGGGLGVLVVLFAQRSRTPCPEGPRTCSPDGYLPGGHATPAGLAIGIVVGAVALWLAFRLVNWIIERSLADRR